MKGNKLEVDITNTGTRDGAEVAQLYVRRPSDTEGPLKSLRGFQRVSVPAGKTVKVSFPLDDDTFLAWSDEAQDMVAMPGAWELLYGGSSDSLKSLSYTYKK